MATVKISALTELTTAATDDVIAIVDTSAGTTKKIQVSNLPATSDSTKLPLAGGTLTGNLSLGDNVKAQFGAGNDLEIYHDGSNSYIKER